MQEGVSRVLRGEASARGFRGCGMVRSARVLKGVLVLFFPPPKSAKVT